MHLIESHHARWRTRILSCVCQASQVLKILRKMPVSGVNSVSTVFVLCCVLFMSKLVLSVVHIWRKKINEFVPSLLNKFMLHFEMIF